VRVRRILRRFIFHSVSGSPFFLFISLSRIVRFNPTFRAPQNTSVWPIHSFFLGALGSCHVLRLSPMTAFYANAIASIITAELSAQLEFPGCNYLPMRGNTCKYDWVRS